MPAGVSTKCDLLVHTPRAAAAANRRRRRAHTAPSSLCGKCPPREVAVRVLTSERVAAAYGRSLEALAQGYVLKTRTRRVFHTPKFMTRDNHFLYQPTCTRYL